jgi:S1-C subfamily serine protease
MYVGEPDKLSNNNDNDKSLGTLTSLSDAIVTVAGKVSPSVVGVQTGRMVSGSGIIWSSEGYIVTCHHVVRGLKRAQISSHELGTMPADIIGSDQ